ncbi:hypothetical protein [Nocardia xishanensis]|uniref:hypothetical protein n=1 Tax=Nocardia xishanensis TaxID=238964 RepID=UPI000833C8A0|nr:hypothetical protein [Nocardia xishanensis]
MALDQTQPPAVLPLVGVSSVAQLTENLADTELTLPEDAVRRLEAAAPFERGFPGDFLAECEPHPFLFGTAATRVDGRRGASL